MRNNWDNNTAMLISCLVTINWRSYPIIFRQGRRKAEKTPQAFSGNELRCSAVNSTRFFRKEWPFGQWGTGTSRWAWVMTSGLQKRVSAVELRQLHWGNKGKWSGNVTGWFSEALILRGYEPFSERKACDLVRWQTALGQEKDRPNKWLQSETRPIASSFGLVRARLNHALYRHWTLVVAKTR